MKMMIAILATVLLVPLLYAQPQAIKIIKKDGQQISVAAAAGLRLTFAKDRTHALVISQNVGPDLEANLTDIEKIIFSGQTRVDDRGLEPAVDDMGFTLHQNYPNPFNPSTTIVYELPSAGWVRVQIFNIYGQAIRELDSGYLPSGIHRIAWHGENDNQEMEANGVYICRVEYNNFIRAKKLLFVK